MYLGPTERPPEEPEEKPSRPPLYVRLYRRLRLYWSSPSKGEVCVVGHKLKGRLYSFNRSEEEGFMLYFSAFSFLYLLLLLLFKTVTFSR